MFGPEAEKLISTSAVLVDRDRRIEHGDIASADRCAWCNDVAVDILGIGGKIGDVELEPFDLGERARARHGFAHAIDVIRVPPEESVGKALDARVRRCPDRLGRAQLSGGIIRAASAHVAVRAEIEGLRRAEAVRRVVGFGR